MSKEKRKSIMIMQKRKSIFNLKNKGFTLIELLVVISIIGVLGSTIYTPFNEARKKGRDAKRVAEISAIQSSLELYADDHGGCYPLNKTSVTSTMPGPPVIVINTVSNSSLVLPYGSILDYKYISKALYDKTLPNAVSSANRSALSRHRWSAKQPYFFLASGETVSCFSNYQLAVELETKTGVLSEDADKDLSNISGNFRGLKIDDYSYESCNDYVVGVWNCVYDISN